MIQATSSITDGRACLEAALRYLQLGWSVLPLCPCDHIGVGRVSKTHGSACQQPGKVPWISWKIYQDQLPTERDLRHWWSQLPNSNVGLALGPVSNLIRIDIDGESGQTKLQALSAGDLPETIQFRSGRADQTGAGYLYKIPAGAVLRTTHHQQQVKSEVRFQAKGAQTVLPPSRHVSGGLYDWLPGHSPEEIEAALAPAWLVKELSASTINGNGHAIKPLSHWLEKIDGVAEGGRNSSMASLIGKMLSAFSLDILLDNTHMAIQYAVFRSLNERNVPPLEEPELKAIFASIHRAAVAKMQEPRPIPLTDLGLCEKEAEDLKRQIDESRKRLADLRQEKSQIKEQEKAQEKAAKEAEKKKDIEEVRVGFSKLGLEFRDSEWFPGDWKLVIVESEPVTYRLLTPFLGPKGVVMTVDEFDSPLGVHKAVLRETTDTCLADKPRAWELIWNGYKNYRALKAKLLEDATREGAPIEVKRSCVVAQWLLRRLLAVRKVTEAADVDGKSHSYLLPDGVRIFEFMHVWREAKSSEDEIKRPEMSKLVESLGPKKRFLGDKCYLELDGAAVDKLRKLLNGDQNH